MEDKFDIDKIKINMHEFTQEDVKNDRFYCAWNVVKFSFATNMVFANEYLILFGIFLVICLRFDLK